MIFIDWWSPRGHVFFNKSFFNALGLENQKLYIFDKKLVLDNQKVFCFEIESRLMRFFKILKICLTNTNKKIIFLSYDPIFIPILSILKRNIFLIEHNTVPENKNKHYFFQKIFFKKQNRLCLTIEQKNLLKKITPNAEYIGAPLFDFDEQLEFQGMDLFIPSLRYDADIVRKLVKKNTFLKFHIKDSKKLPVDLKNSSNLIVHNRINLEEITTHVGAMLYALPNSARFSGWYNEAIYNKLPIIFLSEKMNNAFQSQFNGFPSILSEEELCLDEIGDIKNRANKFNSLDFIKKNNVSFRTRFFEYINHFNKL